MNAIDTYYNDPSHRRSEEAAVKAERAVRAKQRQEAERFYREAAEAELTVAVRVGDDGSEPVLRSLFAVSTVALFFKAKDFAKARNSAYLFLARPECLSSDGRDELEGLLAKIAREASLKQLMTEQPNAAALDLVLSGGQVGHGLIASRATIPRREAFQSLVDRAWELKGGRDFRRRGISTANVLLLEQATYSGSFGLRFIIMQKDERPNPSNDEPSARDVASYILELAKLATTSPDHLKDEVEDPAYAKAFLTAFRDLAADGKAIGSITLGYAATFDESVTLSHTVREQITTTLRTLDDREATPIRLEGVLKVVHLRGSEPKIGIEDLEGKYHELRIERGTQDDTIGAKVNRHVIVQGVKDLERDGERDNWAHDVQVAED